MPNPPHFTGFIRLTTETLVAGRSYPAGSIVEVDKARRDHLVNARHAVDDPGPAREATAEDPAPTSPARSAKVEKR